MRRTYSGLLRSTFFAGFGTVFLVEDSLVTEGSFLIASFEEFRADVGDEGEVTEISGSLVGEAVLLPIRRKKVQ